MGEVMEFQSGCVPVLVAATVLGMDKEILKDSMTSGELEIGFVHLTPKKRGRRSYRKFYISPKKLYELSGFIWRGERTADEVKKRRMDMEGHC